MGEQGSLGPPGGAGGVKDHGAVVERHRLVHEPVRARGEHCLEVLHRRRALIKGDRGALAGISHHDAPGNTRSGRAADGEAVQASRVNEGHGPAVLELELDFGRCQACVERDEDHAQQAAGEKCLKE